MITNEQIDQLITDGSVQISHEYFPPNFARLMQVMDGESVWGFRYTNIGEVARVYPSFLELANTILGMAGYEQTRKPTLGVTRNEAVDDNEPWHIDFAGKPGLAAPGFSILYSVAQSREDNTLRTAGRDTAANLSRVRQYDYSDGPIVLAQRDFSRPDTSAETLRGATWHRGARSCTAQFLALDIRSPQRPVEVHEVSELVSSR